MPRAGQRLLVARRPRGCAPAATVEADAHSIVVGSRRLIVDVPDAERSKIVHGAIVRERIIFPPAALIAGSCVTVAIVDPAVESDFGRPISSVKA